MNNIKQRVIYLCHEFGGKIENRYRIANIHRRLSLKHPDICFISPVHSFGHLYNDMSYDAGMDNCLTLLDLCTDMMIFGKHSQSKGCLFEKEYAKLHKIPIIQMDCGNCEWNKTKECGVNFCPCPVCMKEEKQSR